jgi:hypothetical protein
MSNIFQNFLKSKNKINTATNDAKTDGVKMNVKGQRVIQGDGPNINTSTLEKELYRRSSGPPMLNMRTRIKVWGALCGVLLYTYLTYKLIRYRLKADDLDLMEREVYEDVIIKKKLENFK